MRIKLQLFLFVIFIIVKITLGKDKQKSVLVSNKKLSIKDKTSYERNKRSVDDEVGLFWPNRGGRLTLSPPDNEIKFDNELERNEKNQFGEILDKEPPFWGTRGRRDSSSIENVAENNFPLLLTDSKHFRTSCKHCFKSALRYNYAGYDFNKDRRDEINTPFWGNRGRRNSDEDYERNENNEPMDPFWGNRGRRQDEDPFWGARGRRHEETTPFWGNRGRRFSWSTHDTVEDPPFWGHRGRRGEDVPFWGNRGRREDSQLIWASQDKNEESDPFWGNRGRREGLPSTMKNYDKNEESEPFWGSRGKKEQSHSLKSNKDKSEHSEPFWGNRGKKVKSEHFWGNRGRREESEPFWGTRGRREDSEPFAGTLRTRLIKNTQRENLKEVLKDAINKVEDNIENLIRDRRDKSLVTNSFWNNRGRHSQLGDIFKSERYKFHSPSFLRGSSGVNNEQSESSTIFDDRIFAEQPHYILVERSSRSSGEDDPFYISRGKKLFINSNFAHSTRGRRGAIEELVKSVRNDPYYIARGKKNIRDNKIGNATKQASKELGKAKELICATIDLILIKSNEDKRKREINDNDRDRRTILKKLAAQLQIDPYFVSRGKKNESGINEENFEEFINEVSVRCN